MAGESEILIGKDVPARVGQRVQMAASMKQDKGHGTIAEVHMQGGYCSVDWDNGTHDRCLFTGQQQDYYLAQATGEPSPAAKSPPSNEMFNSQRSAKSGPDSAEAAAFASTSHLHKQLLAQEVIKLRREVAQLRAAASDSSADEAAKRAQMEISRLEAQKAEVIAQANAQKAVLAKEVKSLRAELDRVTQENSKTTAPPMIPLTEGEQALADALKRRREFEENFTRTIRDLRRELDESSIKSLSTHGQVPLGIRSLLQLSNERIEKVMEETAQVPVEERLHIEALRLLVENAKLRKTLNEYSEGLLHNTLCKLESTAGASNKQGAGSFFGIV